MNNIYIPTLIKLTETDKRVLIALCFVLIFLFVLAGYIGILIERTMKHQGMQMDNMMHDIVITRTVSNKKEFIKVARKKNWIKFYKATWIPLLILFISFIIWIIPQSIWDFKYDIFDYKETGFTTLFFLPDWNDDIYEQIFGITLIARWPRLLNTPHFEVKALFSYFFLPTFLTGAIWYLINLQSLIARTYKMYKLADAIYVKDLSGYNINKENMDQIKANQANMQQMMWNQVQMKLNGIQMPDMQNNQVNQAPNPNPNNVVSNQNGETTNQNNKTN